MRNIFGVLSTGEQQLVRTGYTCNAGNAPLGTPKSLVDNIYESYGKYSNKENPYKTVLHNTHSGDICMKISLVLLFQ